MASRTCSRCLESRETKKTKRSTSRLGWTRWRCRKSSNFTTTLQKLKNHYRYPFQACPCSKYSKAQVSQTQIIDKLLYDDVKRGRIYSRMHYYGTKHIYEGEAQLLRQTVVPQGRGSLYYSDGSLFQGTFHEGIAQGRCRLITPNGSIYEGIIKDGIIEGYGKCRDQRGLYEGQMLSGIPHGQGTYKSQEVNYNGTYQNGQKTAGTFAWDNNQYIYTGAFENQRFQGQGVLIQPQGKYQGNFHQGFKSGYGVFTWNDGRKYQGQFFKSKLQGYGQLYQSDGTPIYKGHWLDNLPAGSGVRFVMEDGKLKPHLTS